MDDVARPFLDDLATTFRHGGSHRAQNWRHFHVPIHRLPRLIADLTDTVSCATRL